MPLALRRASVTRLCACCAQLGCEWPVSGHRTQRGKARIRAIAVEPDAVHEELVAMCQDIIATQTQEIEMMQAWLNDWYGITYEPMMSHGTMKEVERLEALEGAEFEIAFMEMMIRHHEGAIKGASRCMKKAYHADLLALCEAIIEAQAAEIAQMESWLCE